MEGVGGYTHPYSALWISPSGHVTDARPRVNLNKDGEGKGAFPKSHAELQQQSLSHCVADTLGIHSWGNPNCSFILFYTPLIEARGAGQWLTDFTMSWPHCLTFLLNLFCSFFEQLPHANAEWRLAWLTVSTEIRLWKIRSLRQWRSLQWC